MSRPFIEPELKLGGRVRRVSLATSLRADSLAALRAHLKRLLADVDEQYIAAQAGRPAPPLPHNTLMCVPQFVTLMFELFPPEVKHG
jgi:hypothetical protein